jgi:hypothetical protein
MSLKSTRTPHERKLHESYSYSLIAEYEATGLSASEATMAFCLESGHDSAQELETIRRWYSNDDEIKREEV